MSRRWSPFGPVLDESDVARIVNRCGKKLHGRNAPPLFTLDEYLWLACSLDRVLEEQGVSGTGGADVLPPERRTELAEALARGLCDALDEDFVRGVADRLLEGALDQTLAERQRKILAELSVAFTTEPVRIALLALTVGPGQLLCRDPAEWVRAQPLLEAWRTEDLGDYERYLAARGDERAAARVRRTIERLARAEVGPLYQPVGELGSGRGRRAPSDRHS